MNDNPNRPGTEVDVRPQGDFTLDRGPGHEPSEIGIQGIFLFGAVLIASALVILLILGGWMRWFSRRERKLEQLRPPQYADDRGQYPTPRLQANPGVDYQEYARREEAELSGYGWADRKAGVARIPIDRAIDILAQKGLPARGPKPTATGRREAD